MRFRGKSARVWKMMNTKYMGGKGVAAGNFRGRLLSESIALAKAHAKELGYEPTMDADFAADLREIINSRKPRDLSAWD